MCSVGCGMNQGQGQGPSHELCHIVSYILHRSVFILQCGTFRGPTRKFQIFNKENPDFQQRQNVYSIDSSFRKCNF